MTYISQSLFAGQLPISMPQYQVRMSRLYLRFNHAGTTEPLELEGKLLVDRIGRPILGWEFDLYQPIHLEFGEIEWRPLINKSVKISGKKTFTLDLQNVTRVRATSTYFVVTGIEENAFDWKKELEFSKPDIASLGDFVSQSNYTSNYEEPYRAFILSLIGLNKGNGVTGIGLSSYLPTGYSLTSFDPLMKAYSQLDPFRLKNGVNSERFSEAFYSTSPKVTRVVKREMEMGEVDYLLGTKPGVVDSVVTRMVSQHAELLTLVGEEGLEKPHLHREDIPGLQFALFYANKCVNPILTNEAKGALVAAQVRLTNRLLQETSIEFSPLTEVIARTKLENTIFAIAKANHKDTVTAKEVAEAEKLQNSLLIRVITDPDISDALLETSKNMELGTKEEKSKAATDIRTRVTIELMISPKGENELAELLHHDFSKDKVQKCIEEMSKRGDIYFDSKGKIILLR